MKFSTLFFACSFGLLPLFGSAAFAQECNDDLSPKTAAVRVGKSQFSVADVDKRVASELLQLKKEYAKQRSELRRQAAQDLIDEQLLLAEAKKRNLSGIEELLKAEMSVLPMPTDEAVHAFYEQHKNEFGDVSYNDIEGGLRDYLMRQSQEQALMALLGKLRAATDNEILLPVERVAFQTTGPSKGNEKAPVTIVVFADYQCPFCARALTTMDALAAKYGDKVRFVFQDFPLDFHPLALPAAILARCAGEQGKFWEAHQQLFSYGGQLSEEKLAETVKKLGLDEAKLLKCNQNPELESKMSIEHQKAQEIGISGTPAFLVNGRMVVGAEPAETFIEIIDAELKAKSK